MSIPFPSIVESINGRERGFDMWTRLLADRIVFLGSEIDDKVANVIVAQLLILEATEPDEAITMYIQSPGGTADAGLAIYDTMNLISCPVHTVCVGNAASMGAFLMAAGEPGYRRILPSSRMLIHQISSGARGTMSDMEISVAEGKRLNRYIMECLAKSTGKTLRQIKKAMDRDSWFNAEEAVKFGLVDEITKSRKVRS